MPRSRSSRRRTIFGAPPFDQDPNQNDFFYTNNIKAQNEQENKDASIKGDWDVGVGTLTAVLAYNDQTNFFLTDGASDAFYLYAFTPSCNASFPARIADTPVPPPFNYGNPPGTIVSTTPYASSFQPPYGPTTCGGYQYQQRDQKDWSTEVRLTSPSDQRLRWTAGVYFADIERHVVVSQGSDQTGASLQQNFLAQAFVPTSGPNPTDLLYDDTFNSKVYAGFGQLAYDIVPGLEIALALRYDKEERDVDNNVPTGANAFAQTPTFAFFSNPYINPAYTQTPAFATSGIPSRSKSYDQFQPKLSVNWKTSEEFAIYGSYGYGFRSGGFNSSGSEATVNQFYSGLCLGPSTPFEAVPGVFLPLGTPACTPTSTRNLTDVHDDYKKEVSKAAELGFKSNLLDRSLAINGAIFYTKVDDMQFFNFFAGPFGLLRGGGARHGSCRPAGALCAMGGCGRQEAPGTGNLSALPPAADHWPVAAGRGFRTRDRARALDGHHRPYRLRAGGRLSPGADAARGHRVRRRSHQGRMLLGAGQPPARRGGGGKTVRARG